MTFAVPYRFVRVSTAFEDLEGFMLLRDYFGVEINGVLLVKQENDHTLYQAEASQISDYSTDDNWFTIENCRGLNPAENIDNSWASFVDQIFDQARKELSFH